MRMLTPPIDSTKSRSKSRQATRRNDSLDECGNEADDEDNISPVTLNNETQVTNAPEGRITRSATRRAADADDGANKNIGSQPTSPVRTLSKRKRTTIKDDKSNTQLCSPPMTHGKSSHEAHLGVRASKRQRTSTSLSKPIPYKLTNRNRSSQRKFEGKQHAANPFYEQSPGSVEVEKVEVKSDSESWKENLLFEKPWNG